MKGKLKSHVAEIVGKTFGYWTVVEYVGQDTKWQHCYLAECICGNIRFKCRTSLTGEKTKNGGKTCGCGRWVDKKHKVGESTTCQSCPNVFVVGCKGSRAGRCPDCWRQYCREYERKKRNSSIPYHPRLNRRLRSMNIIR